MADSPQPVPTGAKDFGSISDNRGAVIGAVFGPATVIGSQTNNHYPCSERPDIPPSPSNNVPFRRDRDFVDRGGLLDQIQERCSEPASRVALVGLGGVGKSQLAIEYCYRTREKSPQTWVFWVHASNAARVEQSYRDIAEQVKIPGRDDPKGNIYGLVDNWLRNEKKEKWTLILDNADNLVLFETHVKTQRQADGSSNELTRPLSAYLPQTGNGSILITTRNKEVALYLVEDSEIVLIEPMNSFHAVALLEKKMGKKFTGNDAIELVEALEFMPLAIIQAAAYIKQRGPRSSIEKYLKEFRKNDKNKTSLLNQEAGHLRRDHEAKNSIIITWQISFDHIFQIRPSAADLLSLMSFFDRQGIPEDLLKIEKGAKNVTRALDAGTNEDTDYDENGREGQAAEDEKCHSDNDSDESNESNSSDVDEFESDVVTLRNYSFITIGIDPTVFEMHRLVQLAIRRWLEARDQLEIWKRQFIMNLYRKFPRGDYENWTKCQAFFPHVKSAEAQQPTDKDSLKEWAVILREAAYYLYTKGRYAEAEPMALKSMQIMKRVGGEEDEETLLCKNVLGMIYNSTGKWKDAEKLLYELVELNEKVFGTEDVETLNSKEDLATTYYYQGKWDEAEILQTQVMNTQTKVLGPEHPNTLITMGNLASTYEDQGKWDKTEALQMQTMNTFMKVLGPEHPTTLNSMNNLALTYQNQNEWNKAEVLQMQTMDTQTKMLGPEHPNTLISMGNLALTYWKQNQLKKTEMLEVQVLKMRVKVLGAEHPDTLTSMKNLALTYENQGELDKAEALQMQTMNTRTKVLGPEHPTTLISMSNLALTYRKQNRLKKAETLKLQVLKTFMKVLGAKHPHTLISMNNLAFTYKYQGRIHEAISLLTECVRLRQLKLGPQHPDTLASLKALNEWHYDEWIMERSALEY